MANIQKKQQAETVPLEYGENAQYITFNFELSSLPKINYEDPVEIRKRNRQYVEICAKYDRKMTMAGYCLALGVNRVTLKAWLNGTTDGYHNMAKSPAARAEYQKMMDMMTAHMEDLMYDGKINPVSGIFLSKNNFGYQDTCDLVPQAERDKMQTNDALIAEAKLLTESEEHTETTPPPVGEK